MRTLFVFKFIYLHHPWLDTIRDYTVSSFSLFLLPLFDHHLLTSEDVDALL